MSLDGDEPKIKAAVDAVLNTQNRLLAQMRRVLELHDKRADKDEIDREMQAQQDLAAELTNQGNALTALA